MRRDKIPQETRQTFFPKTIGGQWQFGTFGAFLSCMVWRHVDDRLLGSSLYVHLEYVQPTMSLTQPMTNL